MQSVRKAVSDVIGELKSYNLDDRYSYRFLASKLQGFIETFLKQDAVDRTILKINELWKPLLHIELTDQVDYAYSPYYTGVQNLKKSVNKIPSVYTCKYGNLIKIVNINNSIEYNPTKPFLYKDLQNRLPKTKAKYYWIEDDYVFIPDSDVEEVRGYGLFKDSQEADLFNEDVTECYKPLDSIILVPDYIIQVAKTQLVAELLQLNKPIIEDANPNLNPNEK